MPTSVMIMRHAEKPFGEGRPHGVSIDGIADPESLTPRGWQRAGALVGLFAGIPSDRLPSEDRGPRLARPTHLFASQVGARSTSRRPLETLQPLSERLGLTVDTRFLKEEVGELVAAIRATDGVALISWEHHLIPSIANMLIGDTSSAPQIWPDDRFDVVWVVTPEISGEVSGFQQFPEMLLAGDQATVIADSATTSDRQMKAAVTDRIESPHTNPPTARSDDKTVA